MVERKIFLYFLFFRERSFDRLYRRVKRSMLSFPLLQINEWISVFFFLSSSVFVSRPSARAERAGGRPVAVG